MNLLKSGLVMVVVLSLPDRPVQGVESRVYKYPAGKRRVKMGQRDTVTSLMFTAVEAMWGGLLCEIVVD